MSHPVLQRLALVVAAVTLGSPALAAPVLRHQEDLHGDVAVFGSTLAYDCGAGIAAPADAIASCSGQSYLADTAPDLYWRDGVADTSITATQARSSATLVLPAGANVTYARLYWAALKEGPDPDLDVTLDWLYGPQVIVTADESKVIPYGFDTHPSWYYYQATGDATAYVAEWGAGDFRVTDVDAITLASVDCDRGFSAWTLVVFYEAPDADLRNLALFDGFEWVDPGLGQPSVSVTLNGFLVPDAFTAKMTAFMYEGDLVYTGDHLTFNQTPLTNALNPADNFFNGSRSAGGVAVSGEYDVPRLSGEPGSMAGYDLDTVDVTTLLEAGDTEAVVGADSIKDIFMLGGLVTSVMSLAPNFGQMTKTVVDLNDGAVLPDDVLEYTVTFENVGNDSAVNAVLTDVVEVGLSYVPGSITVDGAGAKTDAAGDDQAEYDAASKTITVRVGDGADATKGGSLAVEAAVVVRFQATIVATSGQVANQAQLRAAGLSGGGEKTWLSDGDPVALGAQPTVVIIDECQSDVQCSGTRPVCDLATHSCVACRGDEDCQDPALPACQPSGACGECSATNDEKCQGDEPVCDVATGNCVRCTLGPQGDASACADSPDGPKCVAGQGGTVHCGCYEDADCGDPTSGRVCDTAGQTCIEGCRGAGGNGCPSDLVCSSTDTTIGDCVPPAPPGNDGGPGVAAGDASGCGCAAARERTGALGLVALLGLCALLRRRRSR